MNLLKAYLLRCLLCAPAIAGILAFVYRDKPPALGENVHASYLVAALLFTCCACCGWALRIRPTRFREFFSSSLIAGMIASGIIALSDWQPTDNAFFLQYFCSNGYLLTFALTAPIAIAALTALGCLIPDDNDTL